MMALDRTQTCGQPTVLDERQRRKSADVSSLDSWSDVLNASHNLTSPDSYHNDINTHFVGDRRLGSGSSCNRVPIVNSVHTDSSSRPEPYREYDTHLQSSFPPSNYDVVDGASPPSGHVQRPTPRSHNNVFFGNHNRHHPVSHHRPEAKSREETSWFNNITQSNSKTRHYRPHAFSTGQAESGIPTQFGIGAQSRLSGFDPSGFGNVGQNGHDGQSSDERGEFDLADQLDRESEKLKTKFMSVWNNVKYGWTLKTKTNFKCDSPIILLGKCYHRRGEAVPDAGSPQPHSSSCRLSNLDEFHQDFSSRMWFTYRREFSPLLGTKLTSDCGWGCMLRSGQMLLAQGLVNHFLGREWRVFHDPKPEHKAFYREIIRWFSDQLSDQVPFSIHKMVEAGLKHGKSPGNWYGPASVSLILRDALIKANSSLPVLNDVCVYVAPDCTVYKQDVYDLCTSRPKSHSHSSVDDTEDHDQGPDRDKWKRALILLIPMRLGGEVLNAIYTPCVKSLLAHDNCIGIIGGKPKHSLYFVGWQEDKLINLDPHYCQDLVDTTSRNFPVESFHCVSPRKLSFSKMDPSCTVGFYLKTHDEFKKFVQVVGQMVIPPHQKGMYPLFIFSDGRCSDIMSAEMPKEQGRLKIRHYRVDRDGNVRSPTVESEDYIIL